MPTNNSITRSLKLLLVGFCMGTADIVPGVSGGTMAFILGIYEELVDSIRRLASKEIWSPLKSGQIIIAFRRSNWQFLTAVAAGILLAVFSLSHTLELLLELYPVLVWSFFFGLVLASTYIVLQRLPIGSSVLSFSKAGMWFFAAVLFAYLLVGLVPVETPNDPWFLFLSGAVAICAMILPGISGSFLLVILGKYEFVLQAVTTRDIASLAYVAAGAGFGLLGFSHVLSWLLHRYHNQTMVFLAGLMLGSLRKIWPWKSGEANVLPVVDAGFWASLAVLLAGVAVVLLLEKLANTSRRS